MSSHCLPPTDVEHRSFTGSTKKSVRRKCPRVVAVVAQVAVVLVAVSGLLSACGSQGGKRPVSSGPGKIGPPTTMDRGPLTEPEGWTTLARSPLSGRSSAVTAWTGTEILVWRGRGAFSDAGGGELGRSDGAAYNPATDRWRPMAEAPFPRPQNVLGAYDYASAWTGRELLVWGGPGPDAAAYNPATDEWRIIDSGPLQARVEFASAWTGRQLVIYGGTAPLVDQSDENGPKPGGLDGGAAYDPSTDSWRRIPASGPQRAGSQAVWDGHEVLLLGGSNEETGRGFRAALALDVKALRWRRLAPSPLDDLTAPPVWTGSVVIVAGRIGNHRSGANEHPEVSGGAASYDPANNRWTKLDTPPDIAVEKLIVPTMVWSGREVVLLGGPLLTRESGEKLQGAALDPVTGTWRALPDSGLSRRIGISAAWAGSELLVWGGAEATGLTTDPQADGARYRPGPDR